MRLRELKIQDAPLMLEWMHDSEIVKYLRADFMSKTINDCIDFIEVAQNSKENLHLAVVDDNDEYMGTVSLKHISDRSAEFGITVRSCAMGKGFAKYAMQNIISKGFTELALIEIYWCVSPNNRRALRFYDKQSYQRCIKPKENEYYSNDETNSMIWYHVVI